MITQTMKPFLVDNEAITENQLDKPLDVMYRD